jgi:LEA14-like dessication related protein
MLCAFIPDPPLTVTTTNSNELVTIDWSEPVNNGSPIIAYRIFIRESDEATFTEETVQCVGSDVSVISNRQCSVTLALLQQAPYSLVKDDLVYVKVISVNVYGDSIQSTEGNGAVIQLVPDAPVSMTNVPEVTDASNIKFTWSDGVSNGGTSVIDYKVLYALEG